MRAACRPASRAVCKEAVIRASRRSLTIPLAAGCLLAIGLCPGCGGPKSAAKQKEEKKEKPVLEKPLTVHTPNGEATRRNIASPARETMYHIKWRDAVI